MSQFEAAGPPIAALLKKALIELRALRKQVRALKRGEHEPIAVIGTACRFPGDCDTPEAYWDLLRNGRSGICEVPRDRFDLDAYYDADPDAPGKMYTRHGGYLRDIDGFDAHFFGISAREAAVMDPQQRLLLEVTWEAIERAGINPQELYGSRTGVFLGIGNWEHAVLRFGLESPGQLGPYSATGSVGSVAAGRISYLLGLTGPNFPVDTACSSSLLSVHLACDSLRRGDCDLALSGGTHLLLLPGLTVCFCRARMLARDGRCKTFDAAADGYVRSEGCGMVVLKRLSDAEADGDRIAAVIRGSATNQDGSSGGLTVPSGAAQEEVIRRALAAAGVDPDQVGYIEAHGTGTKLGDPVEMRALGSVFHTGTRSRPLLVGSLKTNLGHLESSAGIASLLKTVLMMQHQAIPPHLNLTTPNPLIDWERLPVKIPREYAAWDVPAGERRIAGISAFGFSGSNAHLIVEEYQGPASQELAARTAPAESLSGQGESSVLTLSAKDPQALKQLAGRYAAWLQAHPEVRHGDVCFTANTARATSQYRLAIVTDSVAALREALQCAADGVLSAAVWASANLGELTRAATPRSRPRQDSLAQFAQAYVDGTALPELTYGSSPRKVLLPTYPFSHQRFPFQAAGVASVPGSQATPIHPLLGRRLDSAGSELLFEASLSPSSPALLADHQVLGKTVFPGAGFLEMALKAGQLLCGERVALSGVVIREPLLLTGARCCQLVLRPRPQEEPGFEFKICSRAVGAQETWQVHATGTLAKAAETPLPETQNLAALRQLFPRQRSPRDCYAAFAARGLHYGPRFRVLEWVGLAAEQPPRVGQPVAEALGSVRLVDDPREDGGDSYCLHPALLDGCFQLAQILAMEQLPERSYLPVSIERVVLHGLAPAAVLVKAQLTHVADDHVKASLYLYGEDGRLVAEVGNVLGAPLRPDTLHGPPESTERFRYALRWECLPGPLLTPEPVTGCWLILGAAGDATAAELAARLSTEGTTAVQAYAHSEYREHSATRFAVPLTEKADIVRLLTRLAASVGPCHGVVHLLGAAAATSAAGGTLALQSALALVQALGELPRAALPRLFIVTRGAVRPENEPLPHPPFAAPLWGFGRTLAVEQPKLRPVCIDLEPAAGSPPADSACILAELGQAGDEDQIAWRHGARLAPRLVRDSSPDRVAADAEPAVRLTLTEYGSMDYLCLRSQERMVPQAGEVIVAVGAAGLNFRDVLHALGMLREHAEAMGIRSAAAMPFGFECSGTVAAVGAGVSHVKAGDEVISVLSSGSLASFTRGRADFVVKKPPQLSHAEAATLATTFITAIYGLEYLARVQPGDRVLIHAAAGGVGLAAVQLVQGLGGEVFATASPGKWATLRALGVRHVMHSRTQDFAAQVLEATAERGVDVVLNSLNGEFIPSSLSVLAPGGRFIEIGKLGIWSAAQVAQVRPDIRYHSFDLNEIARARPALIAELLAEVGARSAAGRIAPLPLHLFPLKEAAQAFRFMAQGKQVGKVVITVADRKPAAGAIRPDATYLITGGLGVIGLQLASWLGAHGARHLALLGRSEPSAAARATLDRLTEQGATVRVIRADVTSQQELRAAFATIDAELPPLAGVFHAAGVLADAPIGQLTWPRCAAVLDPKVRGGWLLHELTRERALDHFVLFSSMAAVLGNPGQTIYAAANAFLDSLAHYRAAHALPATSINWGAWADGGMAVAARQLSAVGAAALSTASCWAILDDLLLQRPAQCCVVDLDVPTYAARFGLAPGRGLLSHLLPVAAVRGPAPSGAPALRQELTDAAASERRRLLLRHLQKATAKLLGFAIDQVAVDQPLTAQGLDSLMAVELGSKLGQDVGAELPVSLTFDYPTLAKIADFILHEVLDLPAASAKEAAPAAAPASAADALNEMDALLGGA